nr:glutathione S-transferase T3-like [Tanacetum cinerariifolium]
MGGFGCVAGEKNIQANNMVEEVKLCQVSVVSSKGAFLGRLNISDIYEFPEDELEGENSRTNSSKAKGDDEDKIEELAKDYMEPLKHENTGYWQQPNPDDSPVEQVETLPTKKKKKATRNRKKRVNQAEPAPRQTAWTTKEEISLAKGWRSIFENSEHGNARKKDSFWVEVLDNVMRMAQESGAGDEDYIQNETIHYQAECGLLFKFLHCWEVLKDSPKFQEIAFPNFNQGSQGSSKRRKSSGNSMTIGKGQSENKGSKASGSSTMNDDALARLMVTEMTATEVAQRGTFMELKMREPVELLHQSVQSLYQNQNSSEWRRIKRELLCDTSCMQDVCLSLDVDEASVLKEGAASNVELQLQEPWQFDRDSLVKVHGDE